MKNLHMCKRPFFERHMTPQTRAGPLGQIKAPLKLSSSVASPEGPRLKPPLAERPGLMRPRAWAWPVANFRKRDAEPRAQRILVEMPAAPNENWIQAKQELVQATYEVRRAESAESDIGSRCASPCPTDCLQAVQSTVRHNLVWKTPRIMEYEKQKQAAQTVDLPQLTKYEKQPLQKKRKHQPGHMR